MGRVFGWGLGWGGGWACGPRLPLLELELQTILIAPMLPPPPAPVPALQRRLRQRDAEVAAVRAELEAVRRQYSQPSGAPLGAALAGGRPVTA